MNTTWGETSVNIQVFEPLQLSWFGKGQQDCCGHGCASTSHWRGSGDEKNQALLGPIGCDISSRSLEALNVKKGWLGRHSGQRCQETHLPFFFLKIGVTVSFKRCWLEVGCP